MSEPPAARPATDAPDFDPDGWAQGAAALPRPKPEECAACGASLGERYGWCGGCRMALCFPCGRAHFCRSACPAAGCIAGLCVREARDGRLSKAWGLPPE